MTFAAVGSIIQAQNSTTFSLTPGGIGDLILLEIVQKDNATTTVTSVSSSNVTWSAMSTSFAGSTNAFVAIVYQGTVTSTSNATVTIAWSAATPASIRVAGQEFSSTTGSWALDTQGHIDAAGGTNSTFASLTPAASGELYFGWAVNDSAASAGSTSGYTYDIDAFSNGMCFNPACSASAQAPVWGDPNEAFGVMVLVKETGTAAGVPGYPLIPPGRQSPMAYRYQAWPSAAPVLVPVSDSDSGSGADSASAVVSGAPPAAPLIPPGRQSPAAWQWRAGPSGAPLLVPVSDSDSGSGADSASVVASSALTPYPLIPPGPFTPMAFQRQPPVIPQLSSLVNVTGADTGTFTDRDAEIILPAPAPAQGGWWQLLEVNRYREQEFQFYASNPPMSCPQCGEPLTNAPPTDSGSSVELYCRFDGWQYPRDWIHP